METHFPAAERLTPDSHEPVAIIITRRVRHEHAGCSNPGRRTMAQATTPPEPRRAAADSTSHLGKLNHAG